MHRNGRQILAVLALVRLHPGHTSRELARFSELDRYQIARRTAQLEHEGLIRKGPTRQCAIGRRPAVTWNPANEVK